MAAFDPNTYFEDWEEGRLIELTQGYWTIVDEEDYEELAKYEWFIKKASPNLYAGRNLSALERKERGTEVRQVFMHCEIMSKSTAYANGIEVDHRDSNGLDNRRRNLRESTRLGGARNRKKSNNRIYKSIYKGVTVSSSRGREGRSFRAHILYEEKRIRLGAYRLEVDAALAYDRAARKYYGEFARTNLDWDDDRDLIPVSKNSPRKLNQEITDSIKVRLANGETGASIARDLGLNKSTVCNIKNGVKNGKIWK